VRTEGDDDSQIKVGLLGDEEAQEKAIFIAYDRYARPLASYIRERVAPTLDSDEIATVVSEVFCVLARRAAQGKFTANGSLTTFLFRIARFKAIDVLRHKSAQRRKANGQPVCDEDDLDSDGSIDEELTVCVAQKLSKAPGVAADWRTAVDDAFANEIIRLFRMMAGNLPRLQRKVAQVIALHYGDATDEEIANEIGRSGERPATASVKSARREISEKFRVLMQRKERTNTP
jgi:DNA-directed RNA polymerase specialized sigma24 family protein